MPDERHFKTADVDDNYKLEWVAMAVYSMLEVERIKYKLNMYDLSRGEVAALAHEAALSFLSLQKNVLPPLRRDQDA